MAPSIVSQKIYAVPGCERLVINDQFLTIVDMAMYVDTHNPKSGGRLLAPPRPIAEFIIESLSTRSYSFSSAISIYRPFRAGNVTHARGIYCISQVQIE